MSDVDDLANLQKKISASLTQQKLMAHSAGEHRTVLQIRRYIQWNEEAYFLYAFSRLEGVIRNRVGNQESTLHEIMKSTYNKMPDLYKTLNRYRLIRNKISHGTGPEQRLDINKAFEDLSRLYQKI